MKKYQVKIQTSAENFKIISIEAITEKEAWGTASKYGMVIGIE